MTLHSRTGKYPEAVEVSTSRRRRHLRVGVGAILVWGFIGLFGAPTLVQASAISPKAFCAKIPAATVSSLFGQKVTLLGALAEGGGVLGRAGNDVCEFAQIVSGSVSGVTLNYDYLGTGTTSSNIADLKKQKGVSGLVIKHHASIGGTTYSFTDTFSDPTPPATTIHESGMVSYNRSNHYGLVVTKVLSTSKLAKLLTLAVKAR
ncbi:MAG: hypothetical protein WBF51_05000 [Candidatus Dormiibacterota bacterium]|jgi:hypothetical protein